MRLKFFIMLILGGLCLEIVILAGCGQEKAANNPGPINYRHLDIRGECLGDRGAVQDSGYLETEIIGRDLAVRHFHAFYNCCLGYKVDYIIAGNTIMAVESDTASRCRCDCFFNLESILFDISSGTYIVTLIGISGDTVGVDTVSTDPYGLN